MSAIDFADLESAWQSSYEAQRTYQYGTAGFRLRGEFLEPVMFRMGLLAGLRSKKLDGKTIGIMVTASHNPEEDNGVKLVDPRGEMLDQRWELHATQLANARDLDSVKDVIKSLVETLEIDLSKPSDVVYARDTRKSGPALVQALAAGLGAAPGAKTHKEDFGEQTTPILHHIVRSKNDPSYGTPTPDGYYDKLATAFKALIPSSQGGVQTVKTPNGPLPVDCANGIGYQALVKFQELLKDKIQLIAVNPVQGEQPGILNKDCGADFVKTSQTIPKTMIPHIKQGGRGCSLDGDADRLIYYYLDSEQGAFHMLDGDKIAALVAGFLGELVIGAGLKGKLQVGVVQTAYANGASTQYLQERVPVKCVPTGVKHLHHAAEQYQIGVYFEANGHGTVVFSESASEIIATHSPNTPGEQDYLGNLRALTQLINQTVGDALSDLLLVEVVLAHKSYNGEQWDSLYSDLPNRLVKVVVPDRNLFTTEDAERRLVSPSGLQEKMDEIIRKYQKGRSFVRASGTEDAVRVYAEALSRAEADKLAFTIAGMVYDQAGGPQSARPREFL